MPKSSGPVASRISAGMITRRLPIWSESRPTSTGTTITPTA
jgi:hypothetical protein